MEHLVKKHSEFRTWLWIFVLAGFIIAKGLFAFYVVGDLGQPTWDYRPVKDIPAESPYATYRVQPYPQHIRGDKGE